MVKQFLVLLNFLLSLMVSANLLFNQTNRENVKHVKVYYEPGKFGGWPAYHGICISGNEILVGFSQGTYKDIGERHNIDREKEEFHLLARSLDGGEKWKIENAGKSGALILPDSGFYHGITRKDAPLPPLKKYKEVNSIEHSKFCLTARSTSTNSGVSRYWYSYDRGHNWEGPYKLPDFSTPRTSAGT